MRDSGSRRAWGWYCLADEWAARVVADAGIRPGQLVIDLGAGTGALTAPLVATGARVIAVELHPGRARQLRDRFAGSDVTVVERDLATFRWPSRPFRVLANPPYEGATALLRGLLDRRNGLVAADLVLPRALALRSCARARAGRFRGFELSLGRSLPGVAFRPTPRVDSAVLVVRRRGR